MEAKDKILQKSFELFIKKGLTDVSIDDITKAVGVTKGAFYYHYKSKDELLVDVISKYMFLNFDGTLENIRLSTGTVREKIERFFSFVAETESSLLSATDGVKVDPRSFFLLIMEGVKKIPPFATKYALFHEGIRNKIKEMLEEGVRKGELPNGIDSERIAFLLISCAGGAMLQWVVNPNLEIQQLLKGSSDFIWQGINAYH